MTRRHHRPSSSGREALWERRPSPSETKAPGSRGPRNRSSNSLTPSVSRELMMRNTHNNNKDQTTTSLDTIFKVLLEACLKLVEIPHRMCWEP